jgi:predicted porin
MQKKLLALAVASAVAAPAAMANPTVYGSVTLSVDAVNGGETSAQVNSLATDFINSGTANTDSAGAWNTFSFLAGNGITRNTNASASNVAWARGFRPHFQALAASDDSRTRVTSNNSFLGIKGNQKISDNLSAVYQWEFSVNFDQQDASNLGVNDAQTTQSKRNTFVGLAHKQLGTLTLGLQDTPLKTSTGPLDVFGNTLGDYRSIIGSFNGSIRAQNSIMYATPSVFGFQFKGLYGAANETGNGNSGNYFPNASNPHITSLSLSYTGGPVTVVGAKERNIQTGLASAVMGGGNSSSAAPTAAPAFITGSGLNSFFMVIPDTLVASFGNVTNTGTGTCSATSSATGTFTSCATYGNGGGNQTVQGFMAWDTVTETTRAGMGLKFGGLKFGAAWEKTEADVNAVVYRPTALNAGTLGYAGTGNNGTAGIAAATGTSNRPTQLYNGIADRKAWFTSVGYTIGDVTLMASFAKANEIAGRNCFSCGDNTGAKQYTAGVAYALSKNTSMYGLYTKLRNDSEALYSVAGGATGIAGVTPANYDEDPTALSFGMNTKF